MKTFCQNMLFILLSMGSPNAQSKNADRPFGVYLPAGSKALGNNRFQSSKAYDETVKEIKQRLGNSKNIKPIREEINLPHVRAFSLQNTDSNAPFSAINIYLNIQTGITEIFFVATTT